MKMKVSELSGAALDWAVEFATLCASIKNLGRVPNLEQMAAIASRNQNMCEVGYVSWSRGGPLIEDENISVVCVEAEYPYTTYWVAEKGSVSIGEVYGPQGDYYGEYLQIESSAMSGPTPLIAAMRCYVASKLGYEVEVPEELI